MLRPLQNSQWGGAAHHTVVQAVDSRPPAFPHADRVRAHLLPSLVGAFTKGLPQPTSSSHRSIKSPTRQQQKAQRCAYMLNRRTSCVTTSGPSFQSFGLEIQVENEVNSLSCPALYSTRDECSELQEGEGLET